MNDNFYINKDELMSMLDVGQKKAYSIIKGINEELAAKGFITISGKAPRMYLLYKLGLVPPDKTVSHINNTGGGVPALRVVGGKNC